MKQLLILAVCISSSIIIAAQTIITPANFCTNLNFIVKDADNDFKNCIDGEPVKFGSFDSYNSKKKINDKVALSPMINASVADNAQTYNYEEFISATDMKVVDVKNDVDNCLTTSSGWTKTIDGSYITYKKNKTVVSLYIAEGDASLPGSVTIDINKVTW